jgi:hypothetical protein
LTKGVQRLSIPPFLSMPYLSTKRMALFLRLVTLLAVMLSLGMSRIALAGHAQGGDLTYASLGNNIYRISCIFYRDCSDLAAPPAFAFTARNAPNSSCNSNPIISATLFDQDAPVYGNHYCATLTGICASHGPANYEAHRYAANVALPPGQWLLSVEESSRTNSANIVTGQTLHLQAMLDNRSGLQNNSPVFSTLAAVFLPVGQTSIINHNAFDVDGDSLVYSLDRPLNACGTYDNYTTYPIANCTQVLSFTPPCILNCPLPFYYSATLPLAVTNDTIGTCPNKTAVPNFHFDPANGSMLVRPALYDATGSAPGRNKYVIVVKVSEYRRLNGVYALIGSVRRDLLLIVYDCGTNLNPRISPTATVQTSTSVRTQPLAQTIAVQAGEPITVTLAASDANTGQSVAYHTSYNALPGVQVQPLSGGQARVTFTPPLTLRDGLYRVAVTVEDDACPIKGSETRMLTFRVSGSPLANKNAVAHIDAYPNPFTDQVQLQLTKAGVQTLAIYDNLGRVVDQVHSQADGKVQWQPRPELPAGLYLARAADGQQTVRLLRTNSR